ncbi:MAG: hypothetical protein QGH39_00715 [Candidatus Thermoplasmatota archaeon]|nr:hypothetical protein [Candidatus Thermoplasmatota archaeon]
MFNNITVGPRFTVTHPHIVIIKTKIVLLHMAYDDLKKYNGQIYTGMLVGASHDWRYPNGSWHKI